MSRSDRRPLALAPLALATALAALLSAGTAGAYCRTASCDADLADAHTGAVCVPVQESDCGTPLAWPQPCTEFSVQTAGSPKLHITAAQTATVVTQAFATWMAAACVGGGTPHILVSQGNPVTCDQHEYNQTEGNAEIILYHDDMWPYEGSPNTLALTTVTYDLDTGEIYDADMELNSADNHFTLGDTGVDFDLLSIVTHESGHFLGLAHSADPNATMFPSYNQGTINLRKLSDDDITGICTVYPPAGAVTGCDPTPRHGFSALCGAQQPPLSSGVLRGGARVRRGRRPRRGWYAQARWPRWASCSSARAGRRRPAPPPPTHVMKRRRRALALGAGLAALLSSGTAGAYCRTSSCDPDLADPHTGAVCNPPQPDDCGTPIAWAAPCTEFSVQEAGSPKRNITAAQLAQLMTTAFATWMSAPCPGGGTPHILVTQGPEVSCDQHEYNSTEGNAESILFDDDVWPYEGSPNVLALTTVSYDRDTGAIYDADMELNSADTDFTLGDTGVDYDLLSIVTHESGHFLGLAHSADETATMFRSYDEGTLKRTLVPDDVAAICAVYPPAGAATGCDPTPRHGLLARLRRRATAVAGERRLLRGGAGVRRRREALRSLDRRGTRGRWRRWAPCS